MAINEIAPFFGFVGAAATLVFSCMGAAYGTAKSGVGASIGVMQPELVMKSMVPVVMAGVSGNAGVRANAQQSKLIEGMVLILISAEVLALYGLIVGIIMSSRAEQSRAD